MDSNTLSPRLLKRESRPVDDTISAAPGEWRFDKNVSKAFDSHVHKSVHRPTLDLLSSAHAGNENAQLVQLGGVSGDQKPMRAVIACAVPRS